MTVPEFVDAHHHLWSTTQQPRAWLSQPLPELACGDHQAIIGDYGLAQFQDDVGRLDCKASVFVEVGTDGDPIDELMWVTRETRGSGVASVLVGRASLASRDLESQLETLLVLGNTVGVREITAWHPDPVLSQLFSESIMASLAWGRGFGLLARYGLSLDLQIYPQ